MNRILTLSLLLPLFLLGCKKKDGPDHPNKLIIQDKVWVLDAVYEDGAFATLDCHEGDYLIFNADGTIELGYGDDVCPNDFDNNSLEWDMNSDGTQLEITIIYNGTHNTDQLTVTWDLPKITTNYLEIYQYSFNTRNELYVYSYHGD
jgi:hypothetical protein